MANNKKTSQWFINMLYKAYCYVLHKAYSITTVATFTLVSACVPIEKPDTGNSAQETVAPQAVLSPEPLNRASRAHILFAQSALAKLGYKIGPIDGIWGPKSTSAIRAFEKEYALTSANGFLSELNINKLATTSGLSPATFINKVQQPKGISAKLKGKLPQTGPQLIIIDNDYTVFDQPNPFSKPLFSLQPGTGIYLIAEQAGWYQIESINRRQGYIQVD